MVERVGAVGVWMVGGVEIGGLVWKAEGGWYWVCGLGDGRREGRGGGGWLVDMVVVMVVFGRREVMFGGKRGREGWFVVAVTIRSTSCSCVSVLK